MNVYIAHDGENVWGIGESEEDALEDGRHWLRQFNETNPDTPCDVLLIAAQATQELIEYVNHFGGAEPPMVRHGRVWDLQERYKGI